MSTTLQGKARAAVVRLVAVRTKALVAATAVLVLLGLIGLLADEYRLVLLCVLLLQGAIAGYLVTAPTVRTESTVDLQPQLDRASARTLADLSHTRQSILDAIAEIAPKGQ